MLKKFRNYFILMMGVVILFIAQESGHLFNTKAPYQVESKVTGTFGGHDGYDTAILTIHNESNWYVKEVIIGYYSKKDKEATYRKYLVETNLKPFAIDRFKVDLIERHYKNSEWTILEIKGHDYPSLAQLF